MLEKRSSDPLPWSLSKLNVRRCKSFTWLRFQRRFLTIFSAFAAAERSAPGILVVQRTPMPAGTLEDLVWMLQTLKKGTATSVHETSWICWSAAVTCFIWRISQEFEATSHRQGTAPASEWFKTFSLPHLIYIYTHLRSLNQILVTSGDDEMPRGTLT